MAKTSTRSRNIKQFPAPEPPPGDPIENIQTPGEPPSEHVTPFDDPPPAVPAKETQPKKIPRVMTFFERLASIDAKDWGARAKVKVYRLAPLINRLVGSENKFVTIYGEPITEEKLKIDHGSGRYRLYLNFKSPAGMQEKELDVVELDILDPAYPPKIPPGEWMDDHRNKQWAWAKPNGAATNGTPAPVVAVDPLAHLNTFMDIQDRIEARVKPSEPPPPPPAAAPVADPFDTAQKIMNMRTNDPMISLLLQRMEAQDKAAEAARQREYDLQKELRQIQTAPAAQSKSLVDQLMELASISDKLDPLKKLFGLGNGSSLAEAPARRTTGLELAREVAGKLIDSPIAVGIAQYLGSLATRNVTGGVPQAPVMNPGQPQPQQGDTLQAFIANVASPALQAHYARGLSGSDFAGWMADGYPDRLPQIQHFTHPLLPGLMGATAITAACKQVPSMWAVLSGRGEPAFQEWIEEFCAWVPEPEEEDPLDVEHRTIGEPEEEERPERI